MNQPSSRYLTHDFIAYKGLTLKELLLTGVLGMSAVCLAMTLIGLCLGCTWVFSGVGLILGFFMGVRILPLWVANQKAGKPYGYVRKKLIIRCARLGLIHSPYLDYRGVWRKQRRVGE